MVEHNPPLTSGLGKLTCQPAENVLHVMTSRNEVCLVSTSDPDIALRSRPNFIFTQ
jgi:hypothetical protein